MLPTVPPLQYERQREKHEDEEMRHALDNDLAGIRGLLGAPNRREEVQRDVFLRGPPTEISSPAIAHAAPSSQPSAAPVASTSKVTLTFIKPEENASAVDKSLLAKLLGSDDEPKTDEPQRPGPQMHPSRASAMDDVLASLPRFNQAEDDMAASDGEAAEDESDPYDRYVRELAFEKRAAPSDRLKSEAEAALEAADALKRSEAARLKRMHGEETDDEDQIGEGPSRKKASRKLASGRLPEGDDLDEDYGIDGDEVGGFTLGLGTGLEAVDKHSDGDSVGTHESDAELNEEDSGEDEDVDDSSSEASAADIAETELLADLLHRDVEVKDLDSEYIETAARKRTSGSQGVSKHGKAKASLPYTFPCPESHDDFLDLVSGHEDDLPTIIDRIRTLYHPSLGAGNKEKLAVRSLR